MKLSSTLIGAAALSLLVAGAAVAQTTPSTTTKTPPAAAATKSTTTTTTTTTGTTTTKTKVGTPKSPEGVACSQQADQQGLHGSKRKTFRKKCMADMKAHKTQ